MYTINEIGDEVIKALLSDIAASIIIAFIGAFVPVIVFFGRRSIANTPLRVILRRTGMIGTDVPSVIAVPGFVSPTIKISHFVQGLPTSVRLVGLLDAIALHHLLDILHRVCPKENFELVMHNHVSDLSRPLFSVGGASVNEITDSVIVTSLMQRGIWVQYPSHIARILGNYYKIENISDNLHYDYGFLILTRNSWNQSVGSCLIFGLCPSGTWAVTRVLESPMHYNLIGALTERKRLYIWYRLFLDGIGLRRFIELEREWVVVVETQISDAAFYGSEPKIVFAKAIPQIPEDTQGWSAEVQAEFWDRVAHSPNMAGVAGDEPEYSTRLVIEWLQKISFTDENILDFGCGPGRLLLGYINTILGSPKRITEMDQNRRMLERAKEQFLKIGKTNDIEFVIKEGNCKDLNYFSDGYFSTVICWTVLNHIIDDDECIHTISALCRVSSKRVILCDPVCGDLESPVISCRFPSKRRNIAFYADILKQEGFNVRQSIQRFGSPTHPEACRATIIAIRKPLKTAANRALE